MKGRINFHILLQNPRSNSKILGAATPPSQSRVSILSFKRTPPPFSPHIFLPTSASLHILPGEKDAYINVKFHILLKLKLVTVYFRHYIPYSVISSPISCPLHLFVPILPSPSYTFNFIFGHYILQSTPPLLPPSLDQYPLKRKFTHKCKLTPHALNLYPLFTPLQ